MNDDPQWTLEMLFAGRPDCHCLYDGVAAFIGSLGEVRVKVTKTQVSFAGERQFAWVWLPIRETLSRPAGSIVASFALADRVQHPRIVESVEPYPGRWMHHVILLSPAELDSTLKDWLREAYALGQIAGRAKR